MRLTLHRVPRWLLWACGLLLSYLVLSEVLRMAVPHFRGPTADMAFYDFRLWRSGLEVYAQTGRLYDIDTPGYYLPGSRSFYKYPPTFAALLRPFVGRPQPMVGALFFAGNAILLLLAFVLFVRALRPGRAVAFWGLLAFLVWRPTWESLADLQMEPILLFCLAVSLSLRLRGREALAGAALGFAGAFKVYPWILGADLAGRRRWRALVGTVAGSAAALLLVSLVLPIRLSSEFFLRILPRLGGTSLSYDNLSLAANTGRLGLLLCGRPLGVAALDEAYLEPIAGPVPWTPRIVAGLLTVVILAALGLLCRRSWRRAGSAGTDLREAARFSLAVCLLVMLVPTSWTNYQTLLALPFLAGLFLAARADRSVPTWSLLAASALIGTMLFSYDKTYALHPAPFTLIRSCLPVPLILLHCRLLEGGGGPAQLSPGAA